MRDAHFNKRITPACAGKTPGCPIVSINSTDHPRMRGEDETHGLNIHPTRGSPPHARGRRSALASDEFWDGITPACAGKTDFSRSATRAFWDHPRMRGEDRLRISHNRPPYGSPPHARGRQHGRPPQVVSVGITPACAGKTPMKGPYEAHEPDHPRMRGEDS